MNSRSKYYEVFGLTPAASRSEVKKAYRKLAMKFHPDRNPDPKAHKLFLDLTEAYQILTENKPVKETGFSNPKQTRNERTEEQRVKEAQERLRQQQERILRQQNQYFTKMTSGLKWNIFKITVAVSTFLAFILIIEPVLPTHFENHVVTGFAGSYNGLQYNDLIYFETDKNLSLLVSEPSLEAIHVHPEIIVERSFFLRNPVNVWYPTIYSAKKFHVDFSIINLFPVFPLILLIPFFTLRYKRKSYVFLMFYYFSQYIIGGMTLYILFSQNRWLHLLTLGLVEF